MTAGQPVAVTVKRVGERGEVVVSRKNHLREHDCVMAHPFGGVLRVTRADGHDATMVRVLEGLRPLAVGNRLTVIGRRS